MAKKISELDEGGAIVADDRIEISRWDGESIYVTYQVPLGTMAGEAAADYLNAAAIIAAYQPLSSNLTEWAGINPSSNGGSLVAAADYAAMRALLDLEPGTDFYSKSGADAAFQPKATVLTDTTASFTTTLEAKLNAIEAAADVTDVGNVGSSIHGASPKSTPVAADKLALINTEAANVLATLSLGDLKTYLDAFYGSFAGGVIEVEGITTEDTVPFKGLDGTTQFEAGYTPGAESWYRVVGAVGANDPTIVAVSSVYDDKDGAWVAKGAGELYGANGAGYLYRATRQGLKVLDDNLAVPYAPYVVAGALTHTGNTTETVLATITIPGGALGPTGSLRIVAVPYRAAGIAGAMTFRIRSASVSGTIYATQALTTGQEAGKMQADVWNLNAENSQVGGSIDGFAPSTTAEPTSSLDTSEDSVFVITGQCANGADTVGLRAYRVEIFHGA